MEKWNMIKVDPKIKPIHFKDRKTVELIVGNDYYVSFGKNQATICQLIDIDTIQKKITIIIPVNPSAKNGFINNRGEFEYYAVSTHILFPDEIGRTPEEAVTNQVTS